jgi:hypothetical protein
MQILEEIDTHIPADAWAMLTRSAPPPMLDDMVAQFLANGGQIHQVDPGVTAVIATDFTQAINPKSKFTPQEQVAYVNAKATERSNSYRKGDAEAVATIASILPTALSAAALTSALGCSADKMQRLLREHFADDPLADRFRAKDRDQRNREREEELVPAIRAAIASGLVGVYAIAKAIGVCTKRLVAIEKLYRLNIPRCKSGRRKVELTP